MGSDSKYTFSNGNTYPAITLPWGMNCWTPQTNVNSNSWQYQYSADKIRGFKQTHQPSPWIGDYGQFSIMPMTGRGEFDEEKRASWFSHKAETAKPYYYSVFLASHDVLTEIAPTERCAYFRFSFPAGDSSFILVDAFDRGSYIRIDRDKRRITGYSTKNKGGVAPGFKNYFIIECDKDFTVVRTINDSTVTPYTELTGNHVQALIGFTTRKGEKVHLKVASSFISEEQARLNLEREVGGKSFDETMNAARRAWNYELSKVKAEGGTAEQLQTFYSCLYRMLLFPRKLYEIDASGAMIHYSPFNGKVLPGYLFGDTGFWDTFRALFPFLALVYPEMSSQMMQGLVNTYLESGWLPEWSSPGHRSSMIGSNSASVIADAWLKGIRGYNIDTLYSALLKNTKGVGPISTVGRNGASLYNSLGYIPADTGPGGSAARTLEYAYDDFCLFQLATALQRPRAERDTFARRSQYYRNLFDPARKLLRGRKSDGKFDASFNPFRWGGEFVEGNAWHYTWSVFHDFQGLANLMGGHKQMEQMLDSVFVLPPIFDGSNYAGKGGVIHEMLEMQVMNMGQYAHGNQPIQHMIYIYNYCGVPWKAQYHVRDAMEKLYRPTPDGYCGDEDNGQTSAWYVFSAMGLYSVCPGTNEYVIGSPLFRKISILPAGRKPFVIEAPGNSASNIYISSTKLNGKPYSKNFITHSAIVSGGSLQFSMSAQPNFRRGTQPASFPYSFSSSK